jgi:cytochrome c-type biogenesis protein CcmE
MTATNPSLSGSFPGDAGLIPAARPKRTRVFVFLAIIVGALGFLVVKGLGDASLYFRQADEAVKQIASIGDQRFRIQGIVVEGSITESDSAVSFEIEQNAQRVHVVHVGNPPELFKANMPVVLEGRFASGQATVKPGDKVNFNSDRIMIKHDENYQQKNKDRVKDYPLDTAAL